MFENPRWRTADIPEIEKFPYLGNGLTDRRQLCYGDAGRPIESTDR